MGFWKNLTRRLGYRKSSQSLPPEYRFPGYQERMETMRRWDSAATTRVNQGHWSGVSGQPINADLSGWLTTLGDRCEYELANNPLAEGVVSTYTLSTIGPEGPILRVTSKDEKYNSRRELIWRQWAKQAGSNQQLGLVDIMRLWIRSCFCRGEFTDQLIIVPDVQTPVKMRVLPVHAHRLMTPPEFLGDHEVAMGVRRDLVNRRPICYYVSQPYIFGAFEVYTGEFLEIPYRDFIHGFLMQEEDQVRGVPWLAPALDTIAEARDFRISTLDAARAAADWGIYLWTNHPDLGAMEIPADTMVSFERRQQRHVPPGWQPFQVSPQQPPTNWETLYRAIIQEILRPFDMPLMMGLLDSSKHTASSARLDAQLFWRRISYVQGMLTRTLDRLETEVSREAELAYLAGDPNGLPSAPEEPFENEWIWPKPPQVDRLKEAMADRVELQNGSRTLADICAQDNRAVDEVIEERRKIQEALQKANLPIISGIPEKGGGDAGTGGAGFGNSIAGGTGATAVNKSRGSSKNGKSGGKGRMARI